ncbi:MAG TPA: hypothetical protein VLJ59_13765 [Mycobacteriales bacterium]|nr:hypothetical protein [Mycobacteriales bacterium]
MDRLFGQLGKRPPEADERTLRLATYLPAELPPAPTTVRWDETVADWQTLGNDKFGNCVPVAALHLVQNWTAHTGAQFVPTDEQAIGAYHQLNPGWNGAQDESDTGVSMLSALKEWRRAGFAGHQLSAFVSCEPTDAGDVKQAISRFGGVYAGLDLPRSSKNQEVWSVPPGGPTGDGAKGSLGGHCVPVLAYTNRTLTCVSWGQLIHITWDFFTTYCDEAYAVLSPDWTGQGNVAPNGFKLDELTRDLALL